MANEIIHASWLLPFFILFVKGLPILLAIWIGWRFAKRSQSRGPNRKSRFSGSPRSLFPPEGAIVEERRRRAG
jgi:hypothetical protein